MASDESHHRSWKSRPCCFKESGQGCFALARIATGDRGRIAGQHAFELRRDLRRRQAHSFVPLRCTRQLSVSSRSRSLVTSAFSSSSAVTAAAPLRCNCCFSSTTSGPLAGGAGGITTGGGPAPARHRAAWCDGWRRHWCRRCRCQQTHRVPCQLFKPRLQGHHMFVAGQHLGQAAHDQQRGVAAVVHQVANHIEQLPVSVLPRASAQTCACPRLRLTAASDVCKAGALASVVTTSPSAACASEASSAWADSADCWRAPVMPGA
jgi:hypothetical protein